MESPFTSPSGRLGPGSSADPSTPKQPYGPLAIPLQPNRSRNSLYYLKQLTDSLEMRQSAVSKVVFADDWMERFPRKALCWTCHTGTRKLDRTSEVGSIPWCQIGPIDWRIKAPNWFQRPRCPSVMAITRCSCFKNPRHQFLQLINRCVLYDGQLVVMPQTRLWTRPGMIIPITGGMQPYHTA